MNVEQMSWDVFTAAVRSVDAEIANAMAYDGFSPPAGVYDALITGRNMSCVSDESGQKESVFGFSVTYTIINHAQFHGKEFRSQRYKFNEKGLPWTKGFIAAINVPDGTAPEGAEDLLRTLDMAVQQQYAVTVDVSHRTWTNQDSSEGKAISDKILACGGSSLEEFQKDTTVFDKEVITSDDVGKVEAETVPA